MARCHSCSAPLAANSNLCNYCNVRNDVDLRGKHQYSISRQHSKQICPHCEIPLQTIKLKSSKPFYIERCRTCFGLFFDPGEIETLLESSVSHVFEINFKLITSINKDRYQQNKAFTYIKCPKCRVLMNRVNYAHRSGVVVDQCIKHGVWLDSGETTHLMEWKKAGGELLQSKINKKSRIKPQSMQFSQTTASYDRLLERHQTPSLETELLDSVSSLLVRLFS